MLIAAGVGVAPFRSMLKDMVDREGADAVHLTCLNRSSIFLFRDESDQWRKQLSAASIDYVVTQDLKSKERRRLFAGTVQPSLHYCYVAGPPAMMEAIEVVMLIAGVDHDDIRVDSFGGC